MLKWEDGQLMSLKRHLKDRREISFVSLILSGANAKPGKEYIWYEIHQALINPNVSANYSFESICELPDRPASLQVLPVPGMYPQPELYENTKCKPRYVYSTRQVELFHIDIFGCSCENTCTTPHKARTPRSYSLPVAPPAPKKRRMVDTQPATLHETFLRPVEAVLLPAFESVSDAAPVPPAASPLFKPLPAEFSPLLGPMTLAPDVAPMPALTTASRAGTPCPGPYLISSRPGTRSHSPCGFLSNPFVVSHPGTRASSPALFNHLNSFPSRAASPLDLFAHITRALAQNDRPSFFPGLARGLWSRDASPAPEQGPPSLWPSRAQTREPTPAFQ